MATEKNVHPYVKLVSKAIAAEVAKNISPHVESEEYDWEAWTPEAKAAISMLTHLLEEDLCESCQDRIVPHLKEISQ